MDTTQSSFSTRFKIGIFTLVGILLAGILTLLSSGHPFWWRPCQFVRIKVEDATGLKKKSPIRSLGLEIGYLKTVQLTESHVTLGICITAPVEVLPTTRAYIRGEGFLGDKFVELRPVKYLGPNAEPEPDSQASPQPEGKSQVIEIERASDVSKVFQKLQEVLMPSAYAEAPANPKPSAPSSSSAPSAKAPSGSSSRKQTTGDGREIPVGSESKDIQQLVNRVDGLVQEMSGLTRNLKQAIDPEELRNTMRQLNRTLENASKTLAPGGGLNQTAQRSLAKLEDAIEQLRDMMTRINRGEGSIGKLINDPSYAEEVHLALKNINHLLNKTADVRFVVDLGGGLLSGYNGGRGYINLGIWPNPTRYYLLGISSDPRGRLTNTVTTTTAGGVTQITQTQTQETTGILLTGMLGKVFFHRIDLSVGMLYGDGAGSLMLNLGPVGYEEMIQLRNDVYFRTSGSRINDRLTLSFRPIQNIYIRGGLESFSTYNDQLVFYYGAGLTFDDEDIKLLFTLR